MPTRATVYAWNWRGEKRGEVEGVLSRRCQVPRRKRGCHGRLAGGKQGRREEEQDLVHAQATTPYTSSQKRHGKTQ